MPRAASFLCLLTIPTLFLVLSPRSAHASSRRVWLRVFASSQIAEAQRVRRLLGPSGMDGGRLTQVFLRRAQGPRGVTRYQVLCGPFSDPISAALYGLELRRSARFAKAGIRLRRLSVLLPRSFLPLPLRIDAKVLPRFRTGPDKRYPDLADLIVARGYGYLAPSHALPGIEKSRARLVPWKPFLILGEKTICRPGGKRCLRWFRVLHPVEIDALYVPAPVMVAHRDKKRFKVPEGATKITVRGALWEIGRAKGGRIFRLMLRRGSLPPQLHTLVLGDHHKPPFRLVWDKHGPGVYNREGLVVKRIKLRPWEFKRPPLWRPPRSLRGRPPRPRPRGTARTPRRGMARGMRPVRRRRPAKSVMRRR